MMVKNPMPPSSILEPADYRRRIAEIYARARDRKISPKDRWHRFRSDREDLFRYLPQSPLTPEQLAEFTSLRYYPYNPGFRFALQVAPAADQEIMQINLRDDGPLRMKRFGSISFFVEGQSVSLTLFWILGYGGGIFLPFKDATNGGESYGGGRYLIDTIKGADLGQERDLLVVDFNFAYNPSCAYHTHWHCPLAPLENQLQIPIRAGELIYP